MCRDMAASDPGSDVDVDGTDELDVGSESQPQEVLATEHARLRIGECRCAAADRREVGQNVGLGF